MTAKLQVNADRIMSRIARLAELTEPDRLYTRRAFTDLFLEGRNWLEGELIAAGLEVRLDAGANLIGERAGMDKGLGTLMIGSHTDTVAGGGRFDGIAGVVAGLEVAQVLHESGIILRHGLSVVDFLSEEPSDYGASCIGSRAMVGNLDAEQLAFTNPAGESLAFAIRRMGGQPEALTVPLARKGDIAAYLELHIEQGPVLQAQGRPVAIVGGIVGIQRFRITVEGRSGHAGTVPMDMRADALVGASRLVDLVWEAARAEARNGQFVATIGRFDVFPNGANVVPGSVELVLEARSMDDARTREFLVRIIDAGRQVCITLGLQLTAEPQSFAPAVHCDSRIQSLMAVACEARGYEFLELMSGAGHDAMQIAQVAPAAMLFVPCEDGISHNPAETAYQNDLGAGTEILLDTVLALDRQVNGGQT